MLSQVVPGAASELKTGLSNTRARRKQARLHLVADSLSLSEKALNRLDFRTAVFQSWSALLFCHSPWVFRKLLETWGRWINLRFPPV